MTVDTALSSHRTRTNLRPAPTPADLVEDVVLEVPAEEPARVA
jgi:hypothetical protein